MPKPLRLHATAVLDGFLYVLGGNDVSHGTIESAVYRYDPQADSWKTMAPLPEPLAELAACSVEGRILAAGGSAGMSTSRAVHVFDPSGSPSGTWLDGPELPYALRGAAAVTLQDEAFVMGGTRKGQPLGASSDEVQRLGRGGWTREPSFPDHEGVLQAVAIDGKAYLVGSGKVLSSPAPQPFVRAFVPAAGPLHVHRKS
jgi:N-acetylneuraminic acid mutarotase